MSVLLKEVTLNIFSDPDTGMTYQPVQFLESRAPYREGASLAVADYYHAEAVADWVTRGPEAMFQIPKDCLAPGSSGGVEEENVFEVLSPEHAQYMMKGHHSSRHA